MKIDMRVLGRLGLLALLGVAGAGCCGDSEAIVQVHVVDGETGALLVSPIVLVDGEQLYCDSTVGFLDAPVPTDDGGLVIPGDDGGVITPPPVDMAGSPPVQGCETYVWSVPAGFHTLEVSAAGYYSSSEEINTGDGGNAFTCPQATAVETTIALYHRN